MPAAARPGQPVWLINKNPPRITSGGNGNPFFGAYAGSARSGSPFEISRRMTLGLSGFGDELIRRQPMVLESF